MEKINLLQYITRKQFYVNLGYKLIFTLLFFVVVFLVLRIYTNHNRAITVPDFSGLTREQLKTETHRRHLRFSIADSVYVLNYPKGTVVDQNPYPGFKVKKDRLIYITMNAVGYEKVTMPDLRDMSYRQAKASLENRGLRLGKITYIPYIAENIVMEQKVSGKVVAPGDTLYKGSEIELVLGNGLSNAQTPVPDVIGMHAIDAIHKIQNYLLNLGGVNSDNSVLTPVDSAMAFVWKQKPDAALNAQIPKGALVDIWLTIDSTKLPGYDTIDEIDNNEEDNFYNDN